MAGKRDILKELMVFVGFEYDQNGLNKLKTAGKAAENAIQGTAEAVVGLSMAVTSSAIALGLFTRKMAETSSEAIKMARSLGMSYDQFQNIISAGTVLGVTTDEATLSLRNLSKIMGEASRGVGEGVHAFGMLGISLQDIDGKLKDPTAMLLELSKRMRGLSRQKQIDLGTKLGFNRRSIRLIQEGRWSLEQLMKDRAAFSVETKEAALVNENFTYQLERMKWGFLGLSRPVVEITNRLINQFIEPLLNFVRDNPDQMKKWQIEIAQTMGTVVGYFDRFAQTLGVTTKEAAAGVAAITTAISVLTGASTLMKLTGLGAVISTTFAPMLAAATALASWKAGTEAVKSTGGSVGRRLARGAVSGFAPGEREELKKEYEALSFWQRRTADVTTAIGLPTQALGRAMYGPIDRDMSPNYAGGGGGKDTNTVNNVTNEITIHTSGGGETLISDEEYERISEQMEFLTGSADKSTINGGPVK